MPIPVLSSVHVHPVKALRGFSPAQAEVEPWGLAGDRRWTVVDTTGTVVTQRQHARLALASAALLPDGGVTLSAPGSDPLTVEVPKPRREADTITTEIFGTLVEAVPADPAADAWFSAYLESEVRLVHMDDPARRRPVDPDVALPGETVSFADGFPLLATTTSSLDALNSLIAQGDHADEGPLPMNRFRPNVVIDGTAPGPRTAGAASRSARSPSGSPSPAAAAWSPPPTRRPPSAARSPCAPWPGTAGTATG